MFFDSQCRNVVNCVFVACPFYCRSCTFDSAKDKTVCNDNECNPTYGRDEDGNCEGWEHLF